MGVTIIPASVELIDAGTAGEIRIRLDDDGDIVLEWDTEKSRIYITPDDMLDALRALGVLPAKPADETPTGPRRFQDAEGDVWTEDPAHVGMLTYGNLRRPLAYVRDNYGPLEELPRASNAVQALREAVQRARWAQ